MSAFDWTSIWTSITVSWLSYLLIAWTIGVLLEVVYLLPSLIALSRRNYRAPLAVLVNLAFAWTVIGWFVALFLACSTAHPKPDERVLWPVPQAGPLYGAGGQFHV